MDDFTVYQGTTAVACAMEEVLNNQFNTADTTNDIMIGINDISSFYFIKYIWRFLFNSILVISDLIAFDLSDVEAAAVDAGNRMFKYILKTYLI